VVTARAGKNWVPDRQDIVWIDCNPQAGREMRDRHPFLVLSPRAFNERTSLVIGLPMTTAEYNADNPFAVVAGKAGGAKTGKTSYVLCHQPKSFDWRVRAAAPHPLKRLADAPFAEVCGVLNQIMQLA
jgi:mRNA interferase MazF